MCSVKYVHSEQVKKKLFWSDVRAELGPFAAPLIPLRWCLLNFPARPGGNEGTREE